LTYSEKLATRVRVVLSGQRVQEKKMFGGVAFMVNGKMCVTVGKRGSCAALILPCTTNWCEEKDAKP
jgi:uncharacterized Zn-binding protein involved in type VI secretion